NQGLGIEETLNEQGNEKQVFVVNETERIINSVSVQYRDLEGNVHDLNEFGSLYPKEKRRVFFDEVNSNSVDLIVSSPFHATVEQKIVLRREGDVAIKFSFPENVMFGKSFAFSMELCNNEEAETKFKVEETHEKDYFSEPNKTDTVTVQAGACKQIAYSLIPVQKGDTTIYFNVNSSNTNKQLEQPVTVE
ncbi:MAG: hypothetical protein NUV67_03760, partial [archaeon]|nr:hypothetical protein [archaeon]